MKLYIGGTAQGKLALVKKEEAVKENDICDGEYCTEEEIFEKKVIYKFHFYIKRFIKTEKKGEEVIERLQRENKDCILISDEVGSGIVPMEEEERRYREVVGRTLTMAASCAEMVKRVLAGIGMRIK